jgi:aspartate/glutamate racemase
VGAQARQRYHTTCAKHIESDGIDSVILGCTELSLGISSDNLPTQGLDTTSVHVGAILATAS